MIPHSVITIYLFDSYLCSFADFHPPPSELGLIVRYPRPKELTDDEEETSSSPKRRESSPVAEDAGPSQGEPVAEEPVATIRCGVHGSSGRMCGLGKRVISRQQLPALRGHLETAHESTATIKLPERK
jgi:hypothetical protein